MKKDSTGLNEREVQHIMRQLISALIYMNEKNFIYKSFPYLNNIILNYETEEDKENLNVLKSTLKLTCFIYSRTYSEDELKKSAKDVTDEEYKKILTERVEKGPYFTRKWVNVMIDKKLEIYDLGRVCLGLLYGGYGDWPFGTLPKPNLTVKGIRDKIDFLSDYSRETVEFIKDCLNPNFSQIPEPKDLQEHDFIKKNVEDFHQINP